MRAVARRGFALGATLLGVLGSLALVGAPSQAAGAATPQVFQLPASGTFTVTGHGNGHGHGLSQYGAEGAALAGLSTPQILSFYYPGTTLATLPSTPTIRVLLSGGYSYTCVQAKPGLAATGVSGALPSTGSLQIAPSGNGLVLKAFASARCSGTATRSWSEPSAATLDVSSPSAGFVRLLRPDGTSTDYYGSVGAVRSGSGELTINRLSLNLYAQGVAPREMPASWKLAAVQAQTVAARTYADYELTHSGGSPYDICDNSNCQMYGGKAHYDGSGNLLWQDFPAGAANNQNQVLEYRGQAAFTQYSASDGGWTDDGGQPYLTAHADPYDNTASGDPYLTWTRTVSSSSLAAAFGLSNVTSVAITQRDGNGDMGGRVLSGYVYGTNHAGSPATITTTGFGLEDALGLPTNWFTIGAPTVTPDYTDYLHNAAQILFGSANSVGVTSSFMNISTSKLSSVSSLTSVVNQMASSTEAITHEITALTQTALHRNPAAASIKKQLPLLRNGKYVNLEITAYASPEFYRRSGNTPSAFVRALYQDVLGRNPSTNDVKHWSSVLGKSKSRVNVVSGIVKSTEAANRAVKVANQTVFGEVPSASAVAHWRSILLSHGLAPEPLLAAMLVHPLVLAKYSIPTA